MQRMVFTAFVGIIAFVTTHGSVWAQATAQISGRVQDQTGAVLPGVEITATQTSTGIARSTITNETGSYVLTNLAIGPYRLEAVLPGFRSFAQTGIVLQVEARPEINVTLEVGQVAETIEVQANAALVETRNVGVGNIIENARILELPLNGRNLSELMVLGGAAAMADPRMGQNRNPFFKGAVAVAGSLSSSLTYTLDGANHNSYLDNTYVTMPFPDVIQEFKIETGATSAQSGQKPGGTVTMVTKSGTNEFHGNLFEFVRNGMFNARNAFHAKRDTIKRNQFGGTVGGPIARSKMFFFAGYQGMKVREDPQERLSFVPTPAVLAGDFTAFASPACNVGRQITLRAPFVGNRVDPALFSKPAVTLTKLLPSTADPCGKVVFSDRLVTNQHQAVGRIDYQWNANHSVFGRYLIDSIFTPAPFDLNKNLLSAGTNGADSMAQAFAIGDTYLFGAGMVNSFRLAANRIAGGRTTPDLSTAGGGLVDIGVKMFSYEPHTPATNVTGGFSVGSSGGPSATAIFAGSDDFSLVRGNHQLAFGANAALFWVNSYATVYNHGSMQFTGEFTGLGMADYFLGRVSRFEMGTNGDQHKRSKTVSVYAADIWKVNPKVTLNYGLRWEPYFPMIHLDGSAMHFDVDGFKQGIRTKRFASMPPGLFFDGDPGFPGASGMYNHWWNFSPRLGVAWDVNGDGRTSVRASAGTFYDTPAMYTYIGLSNAPPFNSRIVRTDVNYEDPWAGYPGGDPFPVPYGENIGHDDAIWPLYGLAYRFDYDAPTTQVAHWNLSLQKQLGSNWMVSSSYLGNGTSHLWTANNLNPSVFLGLGPCTLNGVSYATCSSTGNTDARRRLSLQNPQSGQYFGNIINNDAGGTASYHGLVLSLQRRSGRSTIDANYTWSHCISDLWATTGGTLGRHGVTNPDDRRFDRGNCNEGTIDYRHLFNLSAVTETPQFSNPALRVVGSGWTVSTIFRVLSGNFQSLTTTQDRALNNTVNQRVNQILGSPYGDKTPGNYLNPAAFALPALGTLGNSGRASVAGPGTWQFDMALKRSFQLREAQNLELRVEAFNVLNAFRMNELITNFNASNFGQVTSAKDPRIMQFALKYVF